MEGPNQVDPLESVIGFKVKIAIMISSVFSIFTCSLVGHQNAVEYDATHAETNTIFTWEFVRHGARAPVLDATGFSVGVEQLTPQGMRQRYLLGKYNAHRLLRANGYGFDTQYTNFMNSSFTDLKIQSTGLYRTINSGYSEMLGFYDHASQAYGDFYEKHEISDAQREKLKSPETSKIPFVIRTSIYDDVNSNLGNQPAPDGLSKIPLYAFKDRPVWEDDIETKSCPYVKASVDLRQKNSTYGDLVVFKDMMYLKNELAEKYVLVTEEPESAIDDMTFMDAYHYADLVFSQRFEGIEQSVVWSDDEIKMINYTQKIGLTYPVDSNSSLEGASVSARQMNVNKILRKPISQMRYWMQRAIQGKYTSDIDHHNKTLGFEINDQSATKYLVYSGHDQQIANILDQILPNYNYTYIKYASQITLELRQDNACMTTSLNPQDECFYIRLKYNGNFIDLLGGKLFDDSAIEDGPDQLHTDSEEKDTTSDYDISFQQFNEKMQELVYVQSLEETCDIEYMPYPNPEDVQPDGTWNEANYFQMNEFLV